MSTISDGKIKFIGGIEPMREGEYPLFYKVGVDGVTRIEYHVENYGDHGIGMCLVYKGEHLEARVMVRALEQVVYENPER